MTFLEELNEILEIGKSKTKEPIEKINSVLEIIEKELFPNKNGFVYAEPSIDEDGMVERIVVQCKYVNFKTPLFHIHIAHKGYPVILDCYNDGNRKIYCNSLKSLDKKLEELIMSEEVLKILKICKQISGLYLKEN